jgi:hypothetical protein
MRILLIWIGVAMLAWGCGGDGPACRVGADCASGVCRTDGTCLPLVEEPDAGMDGGGDLDDDADGGRDGGQEDGSDDDYADDYADGDSGDGGLTCLPNHDERIERVEVPIRAGLRATFRVSGLADWDTAGTQQADGSRSWDLSGDLAGDHHVLAELSELTGSWFAPEFPEASYVSRLREDEDLLGVFQATDSALLLLGVVSPDDGPLRTELSFDPPVVVFAFPLQVGQTWSSATTVSGWASGAISYYQEDYESQVDARGELDTPYAAFDVLRVRTQMTRTINLVPVSKTISYFFVAECFGTVAAVRSREFETGPEFTRAAEVRRLAP